MRDLVVVATNPDTDLTHVEADLTGGVAIVAGAEKWGLDGVPLRRRHPSPDPDGGTRRLLNAATSAAIVLYEAVAARVLADVGAASTSGEPTHMPSGWRPCRRCVLKVTAIRPAPCGATKVK